VDTDIIMKRVGVLYQLLMVDCFDETDIDNLKHELIRLWRVELGNWERERKK
jgi:hypothetical protein